MPTCDSESVIGFLLCAAPSKTVRGGLENIAEAWIVQIIEAEGERVHLRGGRKLIHVGFAREMVGRRGQCAV
jgi:hypothetical protein